MMHAVRGFGLTASLIFASTVAVVPVARAASSATTTTPAAYVYVQVQGQAGPIYGYKASSTGQLTAISGSPFKPAGYPIGSTKTKFFTMGDTLIHSYGVASDGAIGSQIAQIPVFDYAGSTCGSDSGGADQPQAVLDHTGSYVYVLLQYGGDWSCAAYQTYKIDSDGSFTFQGDTEENFGDQSDESNPAAVYTPSILGNESFAYAELTDGHNAGPIAFRRESSGTLEAISFKETDPTNSDGDYYTPEIPDGAPSGNYVVFELFQGDSAAAPQVASYSVDSEGNISTTNTQSDMPTSAIQPDGSAFSPSGSLFALYGGDGIEIYKFNGASPLTLYKTLLSGTAIDEVKWDSSNHLYAISRSENKLYAFTVTTTSVTEEPSISISSPWDMVVVSE